MSSLSLRFTIERGLLRLGPAWALLAGAALGWGQMAGVWGVGTSPLRWVVLLFLALALVELLWGGLWSQMQALSRSAMSYQPALAAPLPPWPYARPQAPLSRLWLWMANGEPSPQSGLGLGATLLAAAGATALMALVYPAGSRVALASSCVVIVLAGMGAVLQPAFSGAARLLGAVVGVALPWLLGLSLWGWQAPPPFLWLMIGGFTLLAFAEETSEEVRLARLAAAVGYGAVIAGLTWAQQPWLAGLAALIFAVPGWRWWRGGPGGVARWHWLGLVVVTVGLWPLSG